VNVENLIGIDLLQHNPHWWSPVISLTYGLHFARRILDKILSYMLMCSVFII